MRIAFFVLLIFISVTYSENMQSQFPINSGTYDNDWFGKCILSSDNNVLVAGSEQYTADGIGGDVVLRKFDLIGNLIWQKTFGGALEDLGDGIIPTSDGNYLVFGGWTRSFASSIYTGGQNYLIATYIIKVNQNGDQIWAKSLGGMGFGDNYGVRVIENGNGEYIIYGHVVSHNGCSGYATRIAKLNSTGNVVWSNCIAVNPDLVSGFCKLYNENNYVGAHNINGNVILRKYNDNGNVIGSLNYQYQGQNTVSKGDLISFANGEFYVVGSSNNKGVIAKFDSSLNLVWEKSFNWLDESYFVDIKQYGNELLAIGTGLNEVTGTFNTWLVKLDGLGQYIIDHIETTPGLHIWPKGGFVFQNQIYVSGACSTPDMGGNQFITKIDLDSAFMPVFEEIICTPFLGEDQTVCAGTSVTLSASESSLACPTLPSNLQTGLVGYWPFCGNANDASGNGNNGTVNGATLTTDRFGNANSAYSFDGVDDRIYTALGSSISSDVTIGVWYNSQSLNGGPFVHIGQDNGGSFCNGFDIGKGGTTLNNPGDDLISGFSCVGYYDSNVSGLAGAWNHAVLIKQNNQIMFYLNGTLVSTIATVNPIASSLYAFFASTSPGFSTLYNGKLDDVSIYNRALTAAEIQQLYTLGQSTYLWSTGDTTSTINVTPTSTTTYWCTVTDANGNVCTDSVTVFVPQIEATDLSICAGETTTLSVSGINSTTTPSACPTLPTNLQNGLVGYWPFCGNANDVSGNGNNGTVNGATLTTDRFGNANSAYSFDGVNDYIQINNSSVIQLTESVSINAWINVNAWYGAGEYFPVLCKSNNPNIQGSYELTIQSSLISGHLNSVYCNSSLSSPFALADWKMITFVMSPSYNQIYLDGVLLLNVNSGTNINAVTISDPLIFGKNEPGLIEFANGKIDDALLFNRALTPSEIQQLYTLGQTTYVWNTGDTTATISVTPTETTTYWCTVTTNGVSCTDSVTVTVQQPDLYYTDIDNDGFGAGTATSSCAAIAGYVLNNTDCDDSNANINTAANEICNDVDDNCNSSIDEGLTFTDYYADLDNDGFGAGAATNSCVDLGAGYVLNNTDCDDTNANINTAANEICNDIDDNCNSSIDEGLTFTDYFADADGDGFGTGDAVTSCTNPGAGWVTNNTDCNDTDANINPGAEDIGGNGIDENCDGQIDNSIAELANAFILYPNPASTNITLQVNSNLIGKELTIYDAVGKIILVDRIKSTSYNINTNELANGNYILRVESLNTLFTISK